MPTLLECLLLIQENLEDAISGRLSATGGYCVKLSIMETFIGVAAPSDKTLRSLDTQLDIVKTKIESRASQIGAIRPNASTGTHCCTNTCLHITIRRAAGIFRGHKADSVQQSK